MATKFEITRQFIGDLKLAIEQENSTNSYNAIKELHPADIAEVYGELDVEEVSFLHALLDKELAADVLIEMEEDEREDFLETIPSEVIAKELIEKMDTDDAADVIGEMPDEMQAEVLQNLDDVERAGDIVDLLNYDEDSAGGLMAKELIHVNVNWDMLTCMREMRKQASEIDELYYVYVVDDDEILLGTVSLKKMLLSRSNAKIKNIYESKIISVNTETSSEEVAIIMDKYDLVSLPVVDQIGRLVGRITIDDVVDVIKEEAEKDYQMISGISEDVEPSDNVFLLTRARIPWLFIGLIGGILGALVIAEFEDQIRIDSRIAFFIPLIAAMGGNVGIQSSSIVVQGLASKSIDLDSTWRKLFKELSVAFLNATIFSVLIFIYNYFFREEIALTMTVSVALFAVMLFASTFGSFIPLILNKFKVDPAVATGPFITTTNDILGIMIYFAIGRAMYGIFI